VNLDSVKLRATEDNDRYALAKICESNTELYDPIMPGAFLTQASKYRDSGIPTTYHVEMIEYENQCIGFVGTLSLNKKCHYLVALYLHKEWQRKGVGEVVLTKLKKNFKESGSAETILLAHNEAVWAKSFYLKNGFEVVSSLENEIKTYRGGLLKSLFLANTVLMKCSL